jgi:hypothetical protein
MGKRAVPRLPKDEIPDNAILHRDGLILGGLPEPMGSGGIPLQPSRNPADINAMPYSVSHDVATAPDMTSVFGSINDPVSDRPSDRYLGFDPGGAPEWAAFLMHPWDAVKARKLGNQARDLTRELYPDDPSLPGRRNDDAADAFRHAYWSYTMAKAFGPAETQLFGNAHEISESNRAGARYMDLYNNRIGRDLAVSAQGEPIDVIRNAVAGGSTRNRPFK